MKRQVISITILIAAFALPFVAQNRDPLNRKETNQLREAAQDPIKRLKLFVEFARGRMAIIEQLRSDPRDALGRGPKLHDLLAEFGSLIDEMDDNVDMYSGQKADIRKPLKEIIQADSEFQAKVSAIQQSLGNPTFANESQDYKFEVDDALDSVSMSLDHARKLLAEQEEEFAKKK